MTEMLVASDLPATESVRPRRYFQMFRKPTVIVSVVLLLVIAFLSFTSPLLFPGSDAIDAANRLQPPNFTHLLGTDELGRDLLARNLAAGQLTMIIAIGAMSLSIVVGVVWGMIAAAWEGWADEILMRLADAVLAVPMILFGLVFVAAFGSNVISLIVVLGVLKAPLTARIVRSATLGELKTDYVRGLVVVGSSKARIVFTEVLPNVVPTIIAQATLNIASAIIVEASLSFMGLGIQPPEATWGSLLKQGYTMLYQAPWYALIPAILILVFVAALNVLGQQLQKALDGRTQ